MNIPSVETLMKIKGMTVGLACGLRQVARSTKQDNKDPYLLSVEMFHALRGVTDMQGQIGHGWETLWPSPGTSKGAVGYWNMGDVYELTLIIDHEKDTLNVGTIGSLVESNPSRFK